MKINSRDYRAVWMQDNVLHMIDQRLIPHELKVVTLTSYTQTAVSIKDMWVRGAPAIGATGAYGVALATLEASAEDWRDFVIKASDELKSTRPTAQNLFEDVDRVLEETLKAITLKEAQNSAVTEAELIADEYVEKCFTIGTYGAELLGNDYRALTHCNAGWLACVDWGTALSPFFQAHRQNKKGFIFVDETRPRSQGSRLTAYELLNEKMDHAIIADNAAGYYMSEGAIDIVIVGADRIANNGDVANKIGTYSKAVIAQKNNIPFYVAAPISTIDFNCKDGSEIPIEERNQDEVLYAWGYDENDKFTKVKTSPKGSKAKNPAFDVTPNELIKGIITEKGIFKPSEIKNLNTE